METPASGQAVVSTFSNIPELKLSNTNSPYEDNLNATYMPLNQMFWFLTGDYPPIPTNVSNNLYDLTNDQYGTPEGQSDPGVEDGVSVHHPLYQHLSGENTR